MRRIILSILFLIPMISCPALPRDIKVLEKMAQGNQNYTLFEPSAKWIGKHTVYNELLNDSSLLQQSAILDSFYLTSQNGCFDKVTKIIDAATRLDTSLLRTLTNNFNPNCDIEQNYKDFYSIMHTYWISSTVNLIDRSVIENIALQCPILGGTVVYSARDFQDYLNKTVTEFEDLCDPESREFAFATELETQVKISIYPNPNNGKFMLQSSLDKFNLIIFDVSGKIVHQENCNQNFSEISLDKIQPGIYFYQVNSPEYSGQGKFIVE